MFLTILAMLLFTNSGHSADADRERLDEESLRSYMAGEYDLIGRKSESTATYTGHVTLRERKEFYKSHERSTVTPTNALLDLTPSQVPIVFPS